MCCRAQEEQQEAARADPCTAAPATPVQTLEPLLQPAVAPQQLQAAIDLPPAAYAVSTDQGAEPGASVHPDLSSAAAAGTPQLSQAAMLPAQPADQGTGQAESLPSLSAVAASATKQAPDAPVLAATAEVMSQPATVAEAVAQVLSSTVEQASAQPNGTQAVTEAQAQVRCQQ